MPRSTPTTLQMPRVSHQAGRAPLPLRLKATRAQAAASLRKSARQRPGRHRHGFRGGCCPRCGSQKPPELPKTLPELAKNLPALERATNGHAVEVATFWDNSVIPFGGGQGPPNPFKIVIPAWISNHPAALVTVHLSGSILFSFLAVRIIDWLAHTASQKVLPSRYQLLHVLQDKQRCYDALQDLAASS